MNTTDKPNSTENNPTTEQLLEALRVSEPSAIRDMGIHLLETGQVNADSTLAELGEAVKRYNSVSPQ